MGDLLLNLSGNTVSRSMLSMVGLPTPQALIRDEGADTETPLAGLEIEAGGGPLGTVLRAQIEAAGGTVLPAGRACDADQGKVHGLVFDASDLDQIESLRALHSWFHPRIRQVGRGGRVVVIGRRPDNGASPEAAASRQALVGFSKSLAKELGRRGATANLITLSDGCEVDLTGPLRFLLSRRSAFVTGQSLDLRPSGRPSPSFLGSLQGKTAVVTGASRGIGRATAIRLSEEGARVLCLDLADQADALTVLAEQIGGLPLPMDITGSGVASSLVEAAGGPLDVVVHNAGITRDKTLARMSEAFWDQALLVNLGAVHGVCSELLATGGLASDGRLVLVSSIAGIAGNLGQTNYAASKAGIIGLTQALSRRFEGTEQAVNAIAPGFVETRLTAAIPFTIREGGRRLSNLGQGGQPQDIADAIAFFSSAVSAGLNGQVLRVCGGSYIGA
jgi:3-oxoacyl-[acyl-carrier protein] reductase